MCESRQWDGVRSSNELEHVPYKKKIQNLPTIIVMLSLIQLMFGSGLKKMGKQYNAEREVIEILDAFFCAKESG